MTNIEFNEKVVSWKPNVLITSSNACLYIHVNKSKFGSLIDYMIAVKDLIFVYKKALYLFL